MKGSVTHFWSSLEISIPYLVYLVKLSYDPMAVVAWVLSCCAICCSRARRLFSFSISFSFVLFLLAFRMGQKLFHFLELDLEFLKEN